MTHPPLSILVYGYGNPGRLDDGLGPALAAALIDAVNNGALPADGLTIESNYQLNVEDAHLVATHDVVIFADADVACADPFRFEPLAPRSALSFTSHSVEPDALLAMAHDMFGAVTRGFVLGIRGHEFNEFSEVMSDQAQANLRAAIDFIIPLLSQRTLTALAAACPDRTAPRPVAKTG
jgi:hydrogenase maturation protease